jgi:gliding motility-associated-like protein
MKRILFFLFLTYSYSIYSQYTLIPDQNFEQFLILKGYDIGPFDGKVLTSNIKTITKLDFYTGGQNFIASLKGIEDFTALTELSITNGTLLTNLDVSKNLALTKLVCSSNRLSSLDISKNIALTELNCSFNYITSLDITKNSNLKYLSASYNQLTTLDLTYCPLLESVQLFKNLLTVIDVTNAVNLNFLSCGENQLTNLDVTKNTLLSNLSCGTNKLSTLDISNNLQLKSFSCEYNDLMNLDFTNNTELEFFRCMNNKLINLDFSNNPLLYEVYCSNNQLTNINISKNIKLYTLICNFNNLPSLDTSKNTSLNFLNCEYNQITSLDVSKNNKLGLLRCNNNHLTVLDLRSSVSWTWWNDYNSWVNNPNLKCINVPDATFFGNFWDGRKDATASYIDDIPPKFESANQTICYKQNLTISDIIVNGYGIKWFNSESSLIELPFNTALVEGKTYYAMNTSGNCKGPRSSVTISLKATPRPIAISPQNLCNIINSTLADLQISGNNIKWYNSIFEANSIPITTSLTNGFTYYVTQSSNGCESERVPVLVNLLNIARPSSISPQTFCIQQNATLNSIAITGQNVKWYDALINGNILDNSTSLQNGITYYASQTSNECESERTAVLINIQNTFIPIANTNQTFCSNQNPTIAAIQVTGTDIKWYDTSSNGSSIAATTNLINGTTYYATQTINNCENPRLGITVSIVNTPASPTANAFQSFCKNENATLSSIQISGQNIKWYDSSISTVTLPNDRLLVNNTTYYASQTIGCESSRIPILIRIQDTPLPLAKSNQQFCIYENPLLSNLTISGTAIKWYDTQVSGNILSNTTPLQNGKTYFATQTINGCESERLAVTPTIQDTAPPTAEAIQSFCVQKNAKISDISILGQNINWFDSLTSSISLPESTLLTNRITYYASQTVNNCESNKISILITILDATNDECINLVDELPYPKFFTPNNDNFNDTWTIDFNYLEPNSSIRIFDRYGKLVKELRNNDSWDGTYLGYMHPASDYWFTVIRKNGSEFKSHFSLKR